ncbi:MAG TPA: hypothetical protein DIW43_10905 [Spongiibacteraceae bacterium]|nr:hypothetical protein [Spongiibacteraceae bacterium]MBN51717.1 hypothetical protein [Spongiibacteraceae bacterium]HCS27954.1 hypothetical protein [Spongiibacteraceae bacterium]|tara:strand:+ start:142 stop:579 length:438 start_codon:yes stop_codon:yes gene_type:complete
MNKQTFSGLLLAALTSFCLPANAEPITVTVAIKGIASNTGSIVLSAYNDPDKWFSEDVAARERLELTESSGEQVSIQLSLEPGEYALTAYHDENDNKKLDSNFIGIPREPTGLSNNHRPRFGPPKYKKAAIEVHAEQDVIEITLQ